ncbi:TIM barrel protein [Luteipulveratus sp. YIM 133132]|uniref:TIM barrel protein n=1 Tax=Luteipulveratus flavus TaxID=3031728 RepID=UPI0023B00E62|nr:TIM barrel protein [Luteipulveratus sp. YIM 133132]MDE9367063.1 TIM barrel protein [Luteipulveratus sp. YIM 133132]
MSVLADRVAAAPISWGVSEVEGWGVQLPPEQVLAAVRDVGLRATELGPDGFLGDDPARTLRAHSLTAVAQFVPVVLHDETIDPMAEFDRAATTLATVGGSTLVLAAVTGAEGYDDRPAWSEASWTRALGLLDELAARGADRGVEVAIHPHVGTMIESGPEVDRVLAGSRVPLCLDTGHLLIGGTDPLALAREHGDRIAHVHLKDVRHDLLQQVHSGGLAYSTAVERGLYVPLGVGDLDVDAIVETLEQQGYSGWYVLEQDRVMTSTDPEAATSDVRTSLLAMERLDQVVRP